MQPLPCEHDALIYSIIIYYLLSSSFFCEGEGGGGGGGGDRDGMWYKLTFLFRNYYLFIYLCGWVEIRCAPIYILMCIRRIPNIWEIYIMMWLGVSGEWTWDVIEVEMFDVINLIIHLLCESGCMYT